MNAWMQFTNIHGTKPNLLCKPCKACKREHQTFKKKKRRPHPQNTNQLRLTQTALYSNDEAHAHPWI